jgi:glutamate synthase (NADPH) large chain
MGVGGPGSARVTTMSTDLDRESMRNDGEPMSSPVDARLLYRDSADPGVPDAQGLYDPRLDKDSCGVGFIADIKGTKSHQIVEDALRILCNLEHRGAVGADPRAGDGAGILVQIPHKFFARKAKELGITLPAAGEYGVGALFMPRDEERREIVRKSFEQVAAQEGLEVLGWRSDMPVDNSTLGETVKPTEPFHMQVFIGKGKRKLTEDQFERALYILRKAISATIYKQVERRLSGYYPVSISCRTVIYKGMFLADQLGTYYPDLHEPDFESAPALFHEYVPHVVARASLPDDRPQRRDQHTARQQQLDGRAPGLRVVGAVRRRHQQALADLL